MKKQMLHVSQTLLPLHGFDTVSFQLLTSPPKTAAGDRKIRNPTGSVMSSIPC
jgi:hypothetical protein